MVVPLVWVNAMRCIYRFRPGEVRRTMATEGQPLVGYTFACPKCGHRDTALHSRNACAEGPWVATPYTFRKEDDEDEPEQTVKVRHPSDLALAAPILCSRCRITYRIAADAFHFDDA